MAKRITQSIFTPTKILLVLVTFLVGFSGYFAKSYVDQYIPTKIEREVAKQFREEVKVQIGEQIKDRIGTEIQNSKNELTAQMQENHKEVTSDIKALYVLLGTKSQTLAPSLKRGTRRNHATLIRTLPISRELLAHAKAKALAEPEAAPKLTQGDFSEITRNLLAEYENPTLNVELWDTLLELASYKTVMNGIEFGIPRSANNHYEVVSLNDRQLKNDVIIGKVVVLGQCGAILRNVRFVNCEFEVEKGPNGERFLRTLLTSSSPTISLYLNPMPGYVKGACEK